ncbi:hypothetical protein [Pseudalkalibacillus hwajinpoensis]|uniref:hypothetical protein n=1 Tax=Guptibacillus hwajinpoensis TaxID=208199 RepID=UPI00146ECAAE|nr:hypothetical protein [Pseudalkalibacillus hwajinpoensis]
MKKSAIVFSIVLKIMVLSIIVTSSPESFSEDAITALNQTITTYSDEDPGALN